MLEKFKKAFADYASNDDSSLTPAQAVLQNDDVKDYVKEQFEKSVIQDIKKKFEQRKQERQQLELQWRLNINYYNGDQFTYIDKRIGDIYETPLYTSFEERNVYNEIAPNLETRYSRLSKRRNNMKNRPASSSAEDRTSAKIGNKILSSTKARLKINDLQQTANIIAGTMGTCIWKTVWDSNAGHVVGVEARTLTNKEESRTPLEEYEKQLLGDSVNWVSRNIHEGDVVTTIHSPFEFYPENISKPLNENRRVMQVVLMSPEEVFERWGVIEEGKENDTYKIMSGTKNIYGGAISGRMTGSNFGVATMPNTVRVYEEHEMPSMRYPSGRLIICTDEHLLNYSALPDTYGEHDEFEYCFDVQQSLKTDGFFGKSLIERLIPIQDKYNAIKNRKQDYLNRLAIGVLMAEEGALVDEDGIMSDGVAPGSVLLYTQGHNPPKYMTMDSLPASVSEEEQNLLEAFNRLSGISHMAETSISSTYVASGTAVAGLSELDDTRIGLEAENIKNCMASIGHKWLILYRNHVEYPRMVEDIGRNDEFEITQFIGSDLTSFDVFIEAEPEASDTLSQRRQKVIELLNSGLFNDPNTGNISEEGRVKVFEMLELGNWEDFISADDAQQRKAERENNAMIAGEKAKIRSFDDDVIHIAKHNNFRLMAEYEERLETNPEIDQLFEEHINQHIHNLQMKNQSDMAQATEVDEGGIRASDMPLEVNTKAPFAN